MDFEGASLVGRAVDLRKSHPHAPALDVLDLVMQGAGRRVDFGAALHPCKPFGQLVAEAFDTGMASEDWFLVTGPNTPPATVAELMRIWTEEVLPKFRARYALAA